MWRQSTLFCSGCLHKWTAITTRLPKERAAPRCGSRDLRCNKHSRRCWNWCSLTAEDHKGGKEKGGRAPSWQTRGHLEGPADRPLSLTLHRFGLFSYGDHARVKWSHRHLHLNLTIRFVSSLIFVQDLFLFFQTRDFFFLSGIERRRNACPLFGLSAQ